MRSIVKESGVKNLLRCFLIVAVIQQGCAHRPSATTKPSIGESSEFVERSQLSDGDFSRLHRLMDKARRGQPITIAVIGGSITEGARASSADKTYGRIVYRWWQQTFPESNVTFFNAGIGATGSLYGALRAQRDLTSRHPDFVIEEWGVNDGDTERSAETVEGLTRQILRQPNDPAVMLLFMMHQDGRNAQEWQSKVGRHYALPMVSYRDVFWPEMQAARLTWRDISPDEIHPNDRGHAAAAQFIIRMLEKAKRAMPASGANIAIKPIPAPMISDRYERTSIQAGADLKPIANNGWTFVKNGLQSETPGSTLEFETTGRRVYISWYRFRGAMGKARVQLDDAKPIVLDGWFNGTWGGYRDLRPVGVDLAPGVHHVRVELLNDKNPESTGHQFRVCAVGAADIDVAATTAADVQLPETCYLFTSFRGNGEDGLHLAYSADGLKWTALNGDKSYLTPHVGKENLMRDPCITRGPDGEFHMVWTDGWNGKTIGYAHSKDLIHWSPQRCLPVMEHEPAARNCWAPEIVYDEQARHFLIFWSTTIPGRFPETDKTGDGGLNHRIYCTTTTDFETLSPTRIFYNGGFDVIDATLLRDAGKFYLILKDETMTPLKKQLRIASSDRIDRPFTDLSQPFTKHYTEGPTAIKIGDDYIVYFDCYTEGHYGAMRSKDLVHWEDVTSQLSFPKDTRHGTVISVPADIIRNLSK